MPDARDSTDPPGAGARLDVLLLEDSPADADLIVRELRGGGYEPMARRVETRDELLAAVGEQSWDVLLLDYSFQGPDTALEALASLAALDVDLPVILISGIIGEEEAADALRAGARDFVNKGNLTRLVPAVARELLQTQERRRRRDGEEALRLSEQRLRLALDAGGMASWEWNLGSGQFYFSETLEAMFGLQAGEFDQTYATFIELVHPDDRTLVGASIEQAIGRDSPAVVYRALWPDGSVHWHERKSQRVRDAAGCVQLMAGVTFDVTEREEAAAALRESEERFRLIAEHAQDMIALLDPDGRFRYLSPSCQVILGYPDSDLVGTTASELIHPDDWPEGSAWGAGTLREVRLRRAGGDWLWVEGLSYVIAGGEGSHFAVIARDISERRLADAEQARLADELRQGQKMEAIGQLAGGIAHDFNNLLTVIGGYTGILLRRLGREADGTKEVAAIAKAVESAASLTRQLLAFSRKQHLDTTAVSLNDVVSRSQEMLERLIGESIDFTVELDDDLGAIAADRGQMEQIVMNLVVNARDAMPAGGRLLITTANQPPDGDAPEAAHVVLCVTDTGEGMAPAIAERIFEPFFTTKPVDAGTGLGLSTVYGIVKQCGGEIAVETAPDAGTTFRISFPQIADKPEVFSPLTPDERLLEGSETVLLVEDSDDVRSIGKDILELYGYKVLLAGNGAEALAVAAGHVPVDVLMTDVRMPRMGGIELAERFTELYPDTRILFASGDSGYGGRYKSVIGSRYLQKPYAIDDLARTLRELLDTPKPAPELSA